MLWRVDEVVLFLMAVAAFWIVIEVAFRLGRRNAPRNDEVSRPHIVALQTALLGLLSLLLAFNFAAAASRYDARKSLIQEEVNAVRMTYLRAQLLPPAERDRVTDLLRTYVASRVGFLQAGDDDDLLEKANLATARVEDQLWTEADGIAEANAGALPTGLFIQALNDLISVNERRRAALQNHVPETVINLLFCVALGALGFIAYGYGLSGRRRHASTAIFAVLIALVLTVILDLDRPRRGLIRVGEGSMLRLQQSLDPGAP